MSALQIRHQQVPDEFARTLRDIYSQCANSRGRGRVANEHDRQLDALLLLANMNGWTAAALSVVLGITRERVRQRIGRAEPMVGLPEVPPAPRKPNPMPPPDRRVTLRPDELAELRRMQAIARKVNGAMPADHPDRQVSVDFSAWLAGYVNMGVTTYYLAQHLGVTTGAVEFRLARHGYRPPPPSAVGTHGAVYKGRKVGDVLRDKCRRGHPMSGDNLRIYPSGRSCRACEQIRYRARRAAVAS